MWKRSKWAVAGVLAGALLLSGCSGGSGGDDESAPSGGSAGASGEVNTDGTLRYVFVQNPSTFDPHKSANAWDNTVLRLAYDQLLWQNDKAEIEPMLATEWEFVDDGKALELKLREDVDFIDGEHFDASVVKANIERAKTVEGSAVSGSLERVDSVEVVDDYTVRFNLNGPAGYLTSILADRAGAMISPAALDNPDLDQNPVGSGMAELTEYIPGQVSRFDRNENYWDPEAAQAAHYEIYVQTASPTRANMVQTDQADLTYLMPQDEESAKAAGLNTAPSGSSSIFSMFFNPSKPPFDDLKVRQAAEHAINRQAIVDGVFFGAGTPLAQVIPPSHWAYDEDVTPDNPDYGYDPELAKKLMAEAGYEDGAEYDFLIPALDDHRALAEAIIPMLEEVGLKANPQVVEPPTVGTQFYSQNEGNVYVGLSTPISDPSISYQVNLEGQFVNPWPLVSDEFNAAWEKSLEGATTDERIPGVHEMIKADKGLLKSVPVLLFEPPSAWNDDVVFPDGFEPQYLPSFRGVGVTAD